MTESLIFLGKNLLLGLGLSVDALALTLANSLQAPPRHFGQMLGRASIFAGWQAIMPLLGWLGVHTLVVYWQFITPLIPWVAWLLLSFLGGKMLLAGWRLARTPNIKRLAPITLRWRTLWLQGLVTSLDALSVGFTLASYHWSLAIMAVLLIASMTGIVCLSGSMLGRKLGAKFTQHAAIGGGLLLIIIGCEILVTSFF